MMEAFNVITFIFVFFITIVTLGFYIMKALQADGMPMYDLPNLYYDAVAKEMNISHVSENTRDGVVLRGIIDGFKVTVAQQIIEGSGKLSLHGLCTAGSVPRLTDTGAGDRSSSLVT